MNSKTEKLREEIEVKINRFDTFREEYSYVMLAREILKACKEAGLRFVPDNIKLPEIPSLTYGGEQQRIADERAFTSQIEEIEDEASSK